MTTQPTGRDPTLQAEIDRAVNWWTRHLSGRLLPGIDAGHVARTGVEAMHAEGWWPHSRPEPIRSRGPAAPPNADFKEAAAKIRGETDA